MQFDPDVVWPVPRPPRTGKRGRPSSGLFDKKAHDRKKAAERRAAKKAGTP